MGRGFESPSIDKPEAGKQSRVFRTGVSYGRSSGLDFIGDDAGRDWVFCVCVCEEMNLDLVSNKYEYT